MIFCLKVLRETLDCVSFTNYCTKNVVYGLVAGMQAIDCWFAACPLRVYSSDSVVLDELSSREACWSLKASRVRYNTILQITAMTHYIFSYNLFQRDFCVFKGQVTSNFPVLMHVCQWIMNCILQWTHDSQRTLQSEGTCGNFLKDALRLEKY